MNGAEKRLKVNKLVLKDVYIKDKDGKYKLWMSNLNYGTSKEKPTIKAEETWR